MAPLDYLRIWNIQPSTFDYVFTGVAPSSDPSEKLAFNSRDGRTHFVHVGDQMGDYRVASYTAEEKTVFNASINRNKTVSIGQVVLRHLDTDNEVILTENVVLGEEGWTARLSRLDTGYPWVLKEGDHIGYDNVRVTILRVGQGVVVVRLENGTHQIVPYVTDVERATLRRVWNDAARAREKEAQEVQLARNAELMEREKGLLASRVRIAKAKAARAQAIPPLRQEIRFRSLIPPEVMYPAVLVCAQCGIHRVSGRSSCGCAGPVWPGRSSSHGHGRVNSITGVSVQGFGGPVISTIEAPRIKINILPSRHIHR